MNKITVEPYQINMYAQFQELLHSITGSIDDAGKFYDITENYAKLRVEEALREVLHLIGEEDISQEDGFGVGIAEGIIETYIDTLTTSEKETK